MSVLDGVAGLMSDTFSDLGLMDTVTISGMTVGAYDTATGTRSTTPYSNTVPVMEERLTYELVQGVPVQAGDLKLIIFTSDLAVEPTVRDTATYNSKGYAVLAVNPVRGVTYELHCRRA